MSVSVSPAPGQPGPLDWHDQVYMLEGLQLSLKYAEYFVDVATRGEQPDPKTLEIIRGSVARCHVYIAVLSTKVMGGLQVQ